MRENFLQRRVIKPLVKLLRQGVTPEKLALSLALSVTLAVIPAFGWSVWLCGLAGPGSCPDLTPIAVVKYFLFPVHVGAQVPLFRSCEKHFRAPTLPPLGSSLLSVAHSKFV